MKYTGTVVFVSHDRYFIDKLATRVFEIGRPSGNLPGNYEDYLWRKQGRAAVAKEEPKPSPYRLRPRHSRERAGGLAAEAAEPKGKRMNRSSASRWRTVCTRSRRDCPSRSGIGLCETALQSFVSVEETQRGRRNWRRGSRSCRV